MKKILFLLLTVVTVCSCYNDDDLWDKVNDLDGRVETLETTVKRRNILLDHYYQRYYRMAAGCN